MTGPELRREREAAEVTLLALARMAGRSTVTVWRWEGLAEVRPSIVRQYRAALAALTDEGKAA